MYYFTSPEFYYRRPIDPILVVLAVYAVASRRTWLRSPLIDRDWSSG
jgi:hypothetical protein